MATARTPMDVAGRTLSVSNLDKVLFPKDGYTKGDLIAYYRQVAPLIVPHLRERPLTLQRYPDGVDAESFFEKHLPKGVPDWMPRVALTSPGGMRAKTTYLICNDEAALVYVANLAAIVLHVWTSRVETIESPDYVFFDLDPGEQCTTKTLVTVALEIRDMLEGIGLRTLVKTSGGMGLHVVVPLAPGYTYEAAKLFAELVAHRVSGTDRQRVTLERNVSKRDQTAVYFDYLQVGRGKTIVAPYSVRARDGAPVSTPLEWSEVEAFARKRGAPWDVFGAFTIATAPKRFASLGDLWGGTAWKKQRLEAAVGKAQQQWAQGN
jgi:bifunctional non-homologous end joining protein LigD